MGKLLEVQEFTTWLYFRMVWDEYIELFVFCHFPYYIRCLGTIYINSMLLTPLMYIVHDFSKYIQWTLKERNVLITRSTYSSRSNGFGSHTESCLKI
jgi:hypothetical protein